MNYKKPKITRKVLNVDNLHAYDLGELYEIIRFYTEKHSGYQTDAK